MNVAGRMRLGLSIAVAAGVAAAFSGAGRQATAQRYPGYQFAHREAPIAALSETLAESQERQARTPRQKVNEREMEIEVEAPMPPPERDYFIRGYPQKRVVPGDRTPHRAPQASPGPVIGFDTIDFTQSYPPDDAIAAGPTHLVCVANSQLQIRTLGGTKVGQDVALTTFFPTETSGFIFDPRVSYDESSGHFILIATTRKSTTPLTANSVLAVSQTSDPTGVWNKYILPFGRGGAFPSDWGDYPMLGYDSQAIYISCNMFTFTDNSSTGNRVFILDKALAIAGQPQVPMVLDNVTMPTPPFVPGSVAFSVRPAECPTGSSTGLMLSSAVSLQGGNRVSLGQALLKVTNPLTNPQITGTFLDTTDVLQSGPAAQSGGSAGLDAGDLRTQKVVFRGGIIWTALTTSASGGGQPQVTVYRMDPTGAGSLLNAFTIADSSVSYYYPTVVPDNNGNAICVFQGSGPTTVPSIYHARFSASDGTFDTPTLTQAGASSYVKFLGDQNRWGDYTDATLDVATGAGVWVQGELATTATAWRMHAALVPTSPGDGNLFRPTGLTAVAAGASTVNLSWADPNSGDDGVQIERKGGTQGYAQIGTAAAGRSSFQDTSAPAGTVCTYRIRAFKGQTFSPYSPEVSATTPIGIASLKIASSIQVKKKASGTVTLTGPAPVPSAIITFTSDSANVVVTPKVTIKKGKTTGKFTVTVRPLQTPGTVTITASYAGAQSKVLIQAVP